MRAGCDDIASAASTVGAAPRAALAVSRQGRVADRAGQPYPFGRDAVAPLPFYRSCASPYTPYSILHTLIEQPLLRCMPPRRGLRRDVIHHECLLQQPAEHCDKLLMYRLVEILLLQRFL